MSDDFETIVVAPAWDLSGSGTGIGQFDPEKGVALTKLSRDDFGHIRVAMADVPGERLEFDVSGSATGLDPACDTTLCKTGNVTLTLLSPMNPAPFPAEEASEVWNPTG